MGEDLGQCEMGGIEGRGPISVSQMPWLRGIRSASKERNEHRRAPGRTPREPLQTYFTQVVGDRPRSPSRETTWVDSPADPSLVAREPTPRGWSRWRGQAALDLPRDLLLRRIQRAQTRHLPDRIGGFTSRFDVGRRTIANHARRGLPKRVCRGAGGRRARCRDGCSASTIKLARSLTPRARDARARGPRRRRRAKQSSKESESKRQRPRINHWHDGQLDRDQGTGPGKATARSNRRSQPLRSG